MALILMLFVGGSPGIFIIGFVGKIKNVCVICADDTLNFQSNGTFCSLGQVKSSE